MDSGVDLLRVVGFAAIPLVVLVAATALSAFRPPGDTTRAVVQHVAAGFVFAAVAVEVMPDLISEHEPWVVAAGLAAGTLLMIGVQVLASRLADRPGSGQAGFIAALTIDLVIDGLLVGIAFALGESQGRLLALVIALEVGSIGLALGAGLRADGMSAGKAVATAAAVGATEVVGAVVGALAFASAPIGIHVFALSVAAVALLYLVTEELLTEAHEIEERPWFTAAFFAGFAAVFLLESLG